MVTACQLRRRLRACGRAGAAVCQYCGRSFCAEHGARLDDGQEICARSRCQQKKLDLERYAAYRDAVAARNQERLCGEARCREPHATQCSKCRGLFCLRHLEEHEVEERRGSSLIRLRGLLCRHCRRRRRLWAG